MIHLGIDVGSITVKVVALDEDENLIADYYVRSSGAPVLTVINILDELFENNDKRILSLGTSGSGGELISSVLGGVHINELIAQTKSINKYYPQVRTVIEIGGQDSKLLLLERKGEETVLVDFSLNTQCAAGTGSFLDQQAARLGMTIEEFSQLALKSKNPPYIAGRCAVFAKSDIIHLQQVGTPIHDIVAGLCLALARNFRSDIGRGKEFKKPILFQGGVSKNSGMIRAFEQVLRLKPKELIIPKYQVFMAAIGVALLAKDVKISFDWQKKRKELLEYVKAKEGKRSTHEHLRLEEIDGKYFIPVSPPLSKVDAYLGIDVGSISTNIVAIDNEGRILSKVYLRTGGDPLNTVREGLQIINKDTNGRLNVVGVGTTGSGREMIGRFVGADVVKNEITSQATAALYIDPKVDTVFEIGGQDSKFIRLKSGAVVDFAMNKACAAGTGSFLEEQGERLNISIDEFGEIALRCERPVRLGERCTVFMESDLIHHQQRGSKKEELIAGLAYSIVYNYLNRVVGNHKIGEKIFFQGGVAWNKAVLAAFRKLTGREVHVPPHHDVTGALGVALIVRDYMKREGKRTNFCGFDLPSNWKVSHFTCKACSNVCEIKKITFNGGQPLFYGSRCGKFDQIHSTTSHKNLPDYFKKREELLFEEGEDEGGFLVFEGGKRGRIGVPRALLFWDKFPFWRKFLCDLGYEVVLSPLTDRDLVKLSVQGATAEVCLPVKIVHGHIRKLLEIELDYLFLPAMINSEIDATPRVNYNCPLIQGMPYIAKGQFGFKDGEKVISNAFHFFNQKKLSVELEGLARRLGVNKIKKIKQSIRKAWEHQRGFEEECLKMGREALKALSKVKGIVILSRSYNGCDRGINLDIPQKFLRMGALPIPLGCLPLTNLNDYFFIHWNYGKRLLAAAELIKKTPNLYGVHLSHFMCGPDSFIAHYLKDILKDKPYLQLELDEHSADAGIMTRCEAFLDSLSFGGGG